MRDDTLNETIRFRATPDLCAEVRQAAERERVTVSEFARRAVAAMAGKTRVAEAATATS
jgi:hypothetical protein